MFVLEDGRKNLFQWDVNRRLIVEDPTITEVHFCNKTGDCSLVVATYTDDTYDGKVYADIPNVLLQDRWAIRAYAYCGTGYTKVEEVFEVKARTKPTDYVYTETEIKRYEDLNKRIDEIEKNGISQEAIDKAVNEYLEENPIGEIPTKVSELENDAGYATEKYVDEKVSNVSVDLSGYATEDYVDEAIAEASLGGEIDLSGYAKKEDIPDVSDFISEIPSEYITETELNAKGFATTKYVDDAINAIELPEAAGGCDIELITLETTGTQIGAILNAGKWPVLETVISSRDDNTVHLPLVGNNEYYYEFGGSINDRRYSIRYSKTSDKWESFIPSTYYFLDENEVVANPTAEATETLTKLMIRSTTYALPTGGTTDLSNYYTKDETYSKTEVDEAIANIKLPEEAEGCELALITDPYTTGGEEIQAMLNAGKWPVYSFASHTLPYTGMTGFPDNGYFHFSAITDETNDFTEATPRFTYIKCKRTGIHWSLVNSQPLGGGSADLTGYATEDFVTQAIETALSGIAQAEGGAY